MQKISTVIQRIQPADILWISQNPIKVNHRIKIPLISNPLVDLLSCLLPLWIRVRLNARISTEWCYGCCKDRDLKSLDAGDYLLVGGYETVTDQSLGGRGGGSSTDIVDTFEYHGVFDARVGKDVAVNPAECIWPETVVKNTVSACSLVKYSDVGCRRLLLHVG